MGVSIKMLLWRIGVCLSAIVLYALASISLFTWIAGSWVYNRFGTIPIWLIMAHLHESPSVLPTTDIVILILTIIASLLYGTLVCIIFTVLSRWLYRNRGIGRALLFALVFILALSYGALGVFDLLDNWFSIRYEIACRSSRSDYFRVNFHSVDPASIVFGEDRKNLLLIVSESLEERFVEGAVEGVNLLPKLTKWRESCYQANWQCQITGASFTAAAQTSLFYGIPRLRMDGLIFNQNSEQYPRFSLPSIWDVFLDAGYACSFVHGGDFKFGALGKMLPERKGFSRHGIEEMRNDPDYLKEPHKIGFGANDEVMFKHLKQEVLRLSNLDTKFVVLGQTINTHCPQGWCSAFSQRGDRSLLAESLLAQDRMIVDFLNWFDTLECAKNTVVVVLGDHHYWAREFDGSTPRRVFNAVRIPGAEKSPFSRQRRFATFDWAPTFIELAGGKLPGDGHFGMGVSLLRDTETLLEKISETEFDRQIQASHADYWDIVLGVQ